MLELQQVTAGYGKTSVLRGVDLSVPAGTAVALLGPNGAGKTTLLRVVSGLITPTAGRILLNDKDVTGKKPDAITRMGMCHIPEGRGIFPSLSVRENIILQSRHGEEQQAIARGIELFPIFGKRLNQVAGSMSGGEQQMLSMLRTYVAHPTIVVVDEPCLGLAPVLVDQIFAALRAIVETGTAMLLVEQYVMRALGLVDRVYVLDRGSIVYEGGAKDVQMDEIFEAYFGTVA